MHVVEIHAGGMRYCFEGTVVGGEQAALGEGRIQEGLTGEAAFEMELKDGKDFAGSRRVDERRRRLEMSRDGTA